MMRWYLATLSLIFVLSCGQSLTEEQLRAKAKDFENKEQWTEAVETYQKLLENFPDSKRADEDLYTMGVIQANNLKDFVESIQTYGSLIEEYPQSIHVMKAAFMIGYLYANDIKDLDKAREAYQVFLQKYPDHELASSVKWELDHLGQDISEIELQLGGADAETTESTLE